MTTKFSNRKPSTFRTLVKICNQLVKN